MSKPSAIDCIKAVKKANPNASESEVMEVVQRLRQMKSGFLESNGGMDTAAFQKKVLEQIRQMRMDAANMRAQAAENILKNARLVNILGQKAFENEPVEAIRAIISGGTSRQSYAGNLGLALQAKAKQASWMGQILTGLKEAGVEKAFEKGALDRDTLIELNALNSKDGEVGRSKNSQALEAAKVIKKVQDQMLRELQDAGSAVRQLDGYMGKQTHDRDKIVAAGREAWKESILQHLDREKSFEGLNDRQIDKRLNEMYDDIATGRWGTNVENGVSDQFISSFGTSPNLSKKTSYSRALHFESPESFYEYNQQFGRGNLMETLMSTASRTSRDVALMQTLGTNPDGAFQGLIRRAKQMYAGNDAALESLNNSEKSLQKDYDYAKGLSQVPGKDTLARLSRAARAFESVTKLGGAIFRSWTHLAYSASMLRSEFGGNILSHSLNLIQSYAEQFPNSAERAKWLSRASMASEDILHHMYDSFGAGDNQPGLLSRMQQISARINFMAPHLDACRSSMAKQVMMYLADSAEKAYGDLPSRTKSALARYGILEDDWKMLQRGVETDEKGRSYMTPEALRNVPEDFFDGGRKDRTILETKLLTMINDHANTASLTPGARETAWLGHDEGLGALGRLMFQFKTVGLAALRNTERVAFTGDNPNAIAKGWRDVAAGRGDRWGLAQHVLLSTMIGYVGSAAKDLATGKTPKSPLDPGTMADALVTGGGFGLLADEIRNAARARNAGDLAKTLLGPTIGDALDTGFAAYHGATGNQDFHKDLITMTNKAPNLFYTKAALDYLVLNGIREHLSPGYNERTEQRVQSHPGLFGEHQDYYFLRPTESIPHFQGGD